MSVSLALSFYLSIHVSVSVGGWVGIHEHRCPQRPEVLDALGTETMGNCELPDIAAVN